MRSWLYLLLGFLVSAPLHSQVNSTYSPLGLNLGSPVPWETEWIFVNIAHHSLAWFYPGTPEWGNWYETGELTPDGYLPAGTDGTLGIIWDAPEEIYQDFIITWEGEAEVDILDHWSSPTVISSEPNRLEVSLDGDRFLFLEVIGNSTIDPVHNIRCVKTEDEFSEATFSDEFLDLASYFKPLRFMDWMQTNNSQVVNWQEYTPDSGLIQRPVSFKYMIELCNILETDPWFCVPLQAGNEFVEEMGQKILEELDPARTVHVELSNEVWNGIFSQAYEAADSAFALGLSTTGNYWEDGPVYYGYRSAQVHNLLDSVWQDADPALLHCPVLSWQASFSYQYTERVLPGYISERLGNEPPMAAAIAPYFGYGLGSPDNESEVSTWSLDQLFEQLEFNTLIPGAGSVSEIIPYIEDYQSICFEWGIPYLFAYEAGQHLVGHGGAENNVTLTQLFQDANRDERMKGIYDIYLDTWKQYGGTTLAMFSSHGVYSKWGSWGIMEYLSDDLSAAPKLAACLDFIASDGAAWTGCSFEWIILEDLEDLTESTSLNIYPNPTNSGIHIETNGEYIHGILLYDHTGRCVLENEGSDSLIDLQHLPSGNYFLEIISNTGIKGTWVVKQ